MKRQDDRRSASAAGGSGAAAQAVRCPFCGSAEVELLALFGSQLLTDQYYCRGCRTPFEHLRADADDWEPPGMADTADTADTAHRED